MRDSTDIASTPSTARAAYNSIADLRREPAGTVQVSCPQVVAQSYLAPILSGYMATHPKVDLVLEATDREVNLIQDRFDLTLRARTAIEDVAGLVARKLGSARRILVASPGYLDRIHRPDSPRQLSAFDTLSRPADVHEGRSRWELTGPRSAVATAQHTPRLISNDLRMQLEAAAHGIGVALLPEPIVAASVRSGLLEQVLPQWAAATHLIYLIYPRPRGMLPLGPDAHRLTRDPPAGEHRAKQRGRRDDTHRAIAPLPSWPARAPISTAWICHTFAA